MATDPRVLDDETTLETPVERPKAPPVSYSARVGANCMLWAMILGMGFFIAVLVFWGITTGPRLLG